MNNKIIVGRAEWCSLNDFKIPIIKAKIDSGAKTSTLHAFDIVEYIKLNTDNIEEKWVKFKVNPIRDNYEILIKCQAKVIDERNIKSSNGHVEKRYIVKTKLSLSGQNYDIEISLSDRADMTYKMLLGREALADVALVDQGDKTIIRKITKKEINWVYSKKRTEKAKYKVGVLGSNSELYSNMRIKEELEYKGYDTHFLDISKCYISLSTSEPEVLYRGYGSLEEFDVIIPRIKPIMTNYGASIVSTLTNADVISLNSSQAIIDCSDKVKTLLKLSQKRLPIPKTTFCYSSTDTNAMIKKVGGAPIIVKLLEGTQGKGVMLADSNKAAESVINAFKSLKANILVQEYIEEAGGSDIRVFVVGGKVVASMKRQGKEGEFRSNVHLGGYTEMVVLTKEEKKIAIQSCKVLGLDIAGVDIIRSARGPLIMEVNSTPGLEGIEGCTGINIAGVIANEVELKLKKLK